MAEFKEVMKQKQRMHEYILGHEQWCSKCPISKSNNRHNMGCDSFIAKHPQEAEEIIMKWAEEHPIKTNADKFYEVFGFEPYTDLCILEKGVRCNKCEYKGATEDGTCCSKWWNEEYKEPDKE